jgi:tetratricopeptide (TPR) repeat protein
MLPVCFVVCASASAAQESADPQALKQQWSELLTKARADPEQHEALVYGAYPLLELSPSAQESLGLDRLAILEVTYEALATGLDRPSTLFWCLEYIVDPWVRELDAGNETREAHGVLDRFERACAGAGVDLSPKQAAIVDLRRAATYLRAGRPDLALPRARAAHGALADEPARLIEATQILADVYTSTGRHERAIQLIEPLLEVDPASRDALRIHVALAHLELGVRDPVHLARARSLLEAEAATGTVVRHRLIALGRLAMLELAEERPRRALEHLDLARSLAGNLDTVERAFLAALEHQAQRAAGRPGTEQAEELLALGARLLQEWRGFGAPPGGLGFLRDLRERTFLVESLALIAERNGAAAAFTWLSEVHSLSTLSRDLEGNAGTVEEVAERLVPRGGLLLCLVYGRSRLLSLLVTDDGQVELVESHAGRNLIQDAREYQRLVSRPPSAADGEGRARDLENQGRDLAERLFPERVRARLARVDELVLVGGDMFAGLAFEGLPVLSARPLGVDLDLWRLPSVPVGLGIARRPAWVAGALDLLLVTNALPSAAARDLNGDVRSVDLSAGQVRELCEAFPPARREVLLGVAATDAGLERELARRPAIVHLFTHGLTDSRRAIAAGLLLSEDDGSDGLLFADGIQALGWPPLVLLSACGAARGPETIGDAAAADLRGAFVRGGARCLVVSNANLNRTATQERMARVTTELARGASVAGALRAARAEAFDAGQDPYYFALLQAFGPPGGPWTEPVKQGNPWPWPWVLPLVGVAAVGWWSTRKRRAV